MDGKACMEGYNVNAKVTEEGNGVDMVATATLLKRPCPNFFQEADAVSGELQLLSNIFCEPNGVASRVNHPRLLGDPSVYKGGFFHIDEVEIKPSHKGHDLGIRVLHEVLFLMKDKWSLAVMFPVSLGRRWCHWKENSRQSWPDRGEPTPLQLEDSIRNDLLIQRQFGRMNFVQASRKSSECHKAWFLTSTSYFPDCAEQAQSTVSRWLSKGEASQIDVYQPPLSHEPSGLDEELHHFIKTMDHPMKSFAIAGGVAPQGTGAVETRRRSLVTTKRLVERGATIHGSRALFLAAAKSSDFPYLLQTLVHLGGNVNLPDEYGKRPLHVAAEELNPRNVEFLVKVAGADTGLTNLDGNTPLQSLQENIRYFGDMTATFGWHPREIDIVPRLQCLAALMPEPMRSSLVDGWMSPRMQKILSITAEHESVREYLLEFTAYRPTPLAECYNFGIARMEYIPYSAISHNQSGLYESFAKGWRQLFETMRRILSDGKTPTVRRIQEYIQEYVQLGVFHSADIRYHSHFLQKGGRIEFAVDALIAISQNVAVDGDDGWEYGTFQDDIETLPANAMDNAFDVARFKCMKGGGGELHTCGPYHHDSPALTTPRKRKLTSF
jgi:hypothetical protein